MTQPIWGQHLILDLGACPRELLVNADHLRKWMLELVDGIGMKAFGAPQVEHFATHSHDAPATRWYSSSRPPIFAPTSQKIWDKYTSIFFLVRHLIMRLQSPFV